MKMKILVFGNPLVAEDSIALKLMNGLKRKFPKVEFREFDSAENLEGEGRDLLILDAAKGIKKVELLGSGNLGKDLEKLENPKAYSMHDFDLGITLKLLKKMGEIDSVRIIAVPSDYGEKKALEEVGKMIEGMQ
ncbi:Uncharacterised protein [Candidatus Gugararchaeum adminiculabundum]|nr:Uncharacterised protein [Candidatus Gugararchaeum adminiculabundum]